MPWHTSGKFAFSPINVVSKKPYRGINTLCGQVCRALATGRARYQRSHCGGLGAEHHEADRAPERANGAPLYPGWELVQREQRGEVGAIT